MAKPALITNAGLYDADIHIDGTAFETPAILEVRHDGDVFDFAASYELSDQTAAEQSLLTKLSALRADAIPSTNLYKTLSGRYNATAPYRGSGMPDSGQTHTFIIWKYMRAAFLGYAGQSVFYMPRPDAFSRAYSGKTTQADYGALITKAGVAYTTAKIIYKATVVSSDAVTSDEVWISKAATTHPDSGATCALVKVGTALVAAGTLATPGLIVDYIPEFYVSVTQVPLKPFERARREDQSLYLAEVNA